MPKPTVILVGADKGGVGKTTVARTLLDYLTAEKLPPRAFDTELPKGTLKRFHPDITEVVDVTAIPDQMSIFDTVSNDNVTVIDVRAGLLSPTLRALRDVDSWTKSKRINSASSFFISSALPSPHSMRSRTPPPSQTTPAISS